MVRARQLLPCPEACPSAVSRRDMAIKGILLIINKPFPGLHVDGGMLARATDPTTQFPRDWSAAKGLAAVAEEE